MNFRVEPIDALLSESMSNVSSGTERRGSVFLQALPEYTHIRHTVQTLLGDRPEVRVWVPRCGAGAEALSWAALLRSPRATKLRIFATDTGVRSTIDGIFSDDEVERLTEFARRSLLVRGADGWEAAPSLRRHLICAEHELLRDPPLGRLDAIGLLSAGAEAVEWSSLVAHLKDSLRIGGLLHVGDALPESELGEGFLAVAPGLYQRMGRHGTVPLSSDELPGPLPSERALLSALAPPTIVVDHQDMVRRRLGAIHPHLLAPHAGWPRALDDALPIGLVAVAREVLTRARDGQAGLIRAQQDAHRITAHTLPGGMVALVIEVIDVDAHRRLTAENARLAAINADLRARLA